MLFFVCLKSWSNHKDCLLHVHLHWDKHRMGPIPLFYSSIHGQVIIDPPLFTRNLFNLPAA